MEKALALAPLPFASTVESPIPRPSRLKTNWQTSAVSVPAMIALHDIGCSMRAVASAPNVPLAAMERSWRSLALLKKNVTMTPI